MRRILLGTIGACLIVGMAPAQAGPSRAAVSPIGIHRIVYSGTPGAVGTLKLVTDADFGCGLLSPNKPNYLRWLLDDGRDGDVDLKGNIVCRNKNLVLVLKSNKNKYEAIDIKRPSKHMLKATFSFDLNEFKSKHLDATAKSKDSTSTGCTITACKDTVGPLKAY
jgi:hypothetical protein